LQLIADVGQGQRHAHERNRRMVHGHGDVQHVDVDGVAVTARRSESAFARLHDFGPLRVILH